MYKIRAMLIFIQFCIFFIIGSRFTSSQLPLDFSKLSVIISPRFVFVLGNAIVIILVIKSRGSRAKDVDLSDEHMKEYGKIQYGYNEQSKKQRKQSISVSGTEKKIRRTQSMHRLKEAAAEKELRRPATFTCRKRDVASTNEMNNEEFRRRVAAFIARQQRSLREQEFSSVFVSCES